MLHDSESMRRFARIELGEDTVPDESTILRFRHLLEAHAQKAALFAEVRALLEEQRLLLKVGTIIDSTILAALSSTKHGTGTQDGRSTRPRARHLTVRASLQLFESNDH